jgi:hypothetical protein
MLFKNTIGKFNTTTNVLSLEAKLVLMSFQAKLGRYGPLLLFKQ